MKQTTLCFVIDQDKQCLLMIYKKRGQGAGKWNVPGGKLQGNETALAACIRETKEETGLTPVTPRQVGELDFYFKAGNSWDNHCFVFIAENFSGDLVAENEECRAEWVPLDKIPFDKMWDSDKRWVPNVFGGKKFHFAYTFGADEVVVEEKDLTLAPK